MELLILIAIAGAAAGLGGTAAIYVICMRNPRQVAPRLAPENRVEEQRHVLEGLNGVHERLPAGEGEVILFEGAERVLNLDSLLGPPLSPFEPLLMNPTDFLVSAILIFFVFSLLIYAFLILFVIRISRKENKRTFTK